MSVVPRSENFSIVSKDHGRKQKCNSCVPFCKINFTDHHTPNTIHGFRDSLFFECTFWKSSAPAALSTLLTSVVLYSLARATLMSPGKEETRVCGCIYLPRNNVRLFSKIMKNTFFFAYISQPFR